jgi:ankyrin repeat protein
LGARTYGENQTPVHYAAKNDADNALQELINIGADVNCRDYKQRTPLHVAAELGMLLV